MGQCGRSWPDDVEKGWQPGQAAGRALHGCHLNRAGRARSCCTLFFQLRPALACMSGECEIKLIDMYERFARAHAYMNVICPMVRKRHRASKPTQQKALQNSGNVDSPGLVNQLGAEKIPQEQTARGECFKSMNCARTGERSLPPVVEIHQGKHFGIKTADVFRTEQITQ